eukprot:699986-Lingulodinium_polyedra.AAC.1
MVRDALFVVMLHNSTGVFSTAIGGLGDDGRCCCRRDSGCTSNVGDQLRPAMVVSRSFPVLSGRHLDRQAACRQTPVTMSVR